MMVRLIKYKAWLKKEKKMGDVLSISWDWSNTGVIDEVITTNPSGDIEDDVWENRAEDVELIQFTSLHDVDGVEIYEGDVLKRHNGELGLVEFENGIFDVNRVKFIKTPTKLRQLEYIEWPTELYEGCKVIGNKFEDGDLLK